MTTDVFEYYSHDDWSLMKAEMDRHDTPFLVVNLNIVRRNYEALRSLYPFAHIYYAVKANPATEVLTLLRDLGSCFDVASVYELDMILSLGVSPDRISYGNTIKKARDIAYAYQKGVRLYTTDSEGDIRNLAQYAPGSRVACRILTEGGDTAEWPLSRKFGCHPDLAISLIMLSKELGLNPCGVSFHVGSQQRDIGAWDSAISKVRYIFDYLKSQGLSLNLVNMGGGFPVKYISKTSTPDVYAEEITRYLKEDFEEGLPEIILEPGRSLVAESGVLVTEVVLVSKKSNVGVDRWVYLDTGLFNGLIETIGESIKYPLWSDAKGKCSDVFILAGPTCDSQDIMYEKFRNALPTDIKPGDRVYWLTTGAYTASYCSVCFNGFPPLKTYFVK